MSYSSELYHHGVKGMKWGVRRTPGQLGRKLTRSDKKKFPANWTAIIHQDKNQLLNLIGLKPERTIKKSGSMKPEDRISANTKSGKVPQSLIVLVKAKLLPEIKNTPSRARCRKSRMKPQRK